MTINLKAHYRLSDQVIARKIEDELIIIPLNDGIGDLDAEMFSLNTTGAVIWDKLDGTHSLGDIIVTISKKFNAPFNQIKEDITDLTEKLLKKGLIIEV